MLIFPSGAKICRNLGSSKIKKQDNLRGEMSETFLEDGGGLAVELDDAGELIDTRQMSVDGLVPLFVV